MRAITVLILLAAVLSASGVGVHAQGKITSDPNAPGMAEPQELVVETDARLDQKITYEAKQKTVFAILTDLSEQTKITFKAGHNNKDWEVRDRKMSIFAKDTALRELMASVARVMKFKWTREGKESAYTYRLYMDRRTQIEAENRKQREEEARQKRVAEKRAKALAAYDTAANLSPQDLAKLKTENPFLYVAASSGILGSIGKFFAESPALVDALTNGKAMTLNSAALSAAGQQAMMKTMQDLWKFENRMSGKDRPFPDQLANNAGQINIRLNRHMEDMRGAGQDFLLGEMSMGYGDRNVELPIFDPESGISKMIGKALIQSQEEGKSVEEVMKNSQAEITKAFMADMKKSDSGEPAPEHPDEPALHAKTKLKVQANRLADVQAELAKTSSLAVVSDSFGPGWGMMAQGLSGDEQELQAILDRIVEAFRYNWEKHGSVLEFRDRKWYEKRAAQIPEAWLESWRDTLKKTGTLDIADLAQIVSLTQEQFAANITSDEVLSASGVMGAFYGSRDVLRLYAVLNDTERAAIFSATDLDLKLLTPEQWAFVEKLINSKNAAYLMNHDARLTLAATRKPNEKQFDYDFTVTTSEELDPLTWRITTPRYNEPKPKEPPKIDPKPDEKQPTPAK